MVKKATRDGDERQRNLDLLILELEQLVASVATSIEAASPSQKLRLEKVAHSLLSYLAQEMDKMSSERTLARKQGDADMILRRVRNWSGGQAEALAWYRSEPIAAFGDRTAEFLVRTGQGVARLSRSHSARRLCLRFVGTAYRAHHPRWSSLPISSEVAAIRGGRFNPEGVPALYRALDALTAIKEASQGFAFKMEPYVVYS